MLMTTEASDIAGATGGVGAEALLIFSMTALIIWAITTRSAFGVGALIGTTGGGTTAYPCRLNLCGCETLACLEVVLSKSPTKSSRLPWVEINGTWEALSTRGSFSLLFSGSIS